MAPALRGEVDAALGGDRALLGNLHALEGGARRPAARATRSRARSARSRPRSRAARSRRAPRRSRSRAWSRAAAAHRPRALPRKVGAPSVPDERHLARSPSRRGARRGRASPRPTRARARCASISPASGASRGTAHAAPSLRMVVVARASICPTCLPRTTSAARTWPRAASTETSSASSPSAIGGSPTRTSPCARFTRTKPSSVSAAFTSHSAASTRLERACAGSPRARTIGRVSSPLLEPRASMRVGVQRVSTKRARPISPRTSASPISTRSRASVSVAGAVSLSGLGPRSSKASMRPCHVGVARLVDQAARQRQLQMARGLGRGRRGGRDRGGGDRQRRQPALGRQRGLERGAMARARSGERDGGLVRNHLERAGGDSRDSRRLELCRRRGHRPCRRLPPARSASPRRIHRARAASRRWRAASPRARRTCR